MQHLGEIVEQHRRYDGITFGFTMLLQRCVETADRVGLESAHGTAAVKDEYELGQIFLHDRSFLFAGRLPPSCD